MVNNALRGELSSSLTRAEYLLFKSMIENTSGLNLENRDWTHLRAALCERVTTIGYASFGEYYELLKSPGGSAELDRLIELLTIHETSFFRNNTHFDILADHIIPEMCAKNSATRSIRIWSAGCSTGQEAYSIAITLMETLQDYKSWQIEVLATDISQRALDIASTGTYKARAMRNVSPVLLERYFEPHDGGYRVRDQVRKMIKFEYLNLVKEPFPVAALRPLDLIFCENVTIYFKVDSTRRVIRNFFDVLQGGGYLFLGYSESLWQISNDFVLRDYGRAFVYQKSLEGSSGWLCAEVDGAPVTQTDEHPPSKVTFMHRGGVRRENRALRSKKREVTLEEAEALYEGRRFEEALLAVESILETTPAELKAQLLAAKLRSDREEIGPALRHCRKVLDIDPLNEEAHYIAGVLQLRSGERGKAVESLSRVVYLNPSGSRSAIAHFHLAGLYVENNDREASIREYRNALRLLEQFPIDELIEEFSAGFLARVCRRRLKELEWRS